MVSSVVSETSQMSKVQVGVLRQGKETMQPQRVSQTKKMKYTHHLIDDVEIYSPKPRRRDRWFIAGAYLVLLLVVAGLWYADHVIRNCID